ncbi:hypothetical protein FEAC_29190 [Ferrimicrobium acidiphilum DSM 19497]|uniref:Uncharacterized protein n=1 Tax=Ferrimicrobium acidiphilum DSM 19497 TaxID=1121877 RepID=A0A0D8FSX2_9ACTN|nr:hypothetical protein FEAC_29190 [Ferrimicrobium acidiphilum DSM 19497]
MNVVVSQTKWTGLKGPSACPPRISVPIHTNVLIADVSSRELVLGPLLQRSVHHSVTELNRGITKWAKAQNENPKPFIRDKERRRDLRFYAEISGYDRF